MEAQPKGTERLDQPCVVDAASIGTRNPCGLFATIVGKRLWAYITQDDEDAAIGVLKKLDEPSGQADSGEFAAKCQTQPEFGDCP